MISVIILTCDSNRIKNGCVRHCIQSVLNQSEIGYEIIIVDNSPGDSFLFSYVEEIVQRFPSLSIKLIETEKRLGRGAARNTGVENASGQLLIFLDEDVILINTQAFHSIEKYYTINSWGCGAERLWTKSDWFNRNAESILEELKKNDFCNLLNNSGAPELFIRGSSEIAIETRSLIGHFGYCDKGLFIKVGGFEDLKEAQSYDDDMLNLKLFLQDKPPAIFSELQIIHVNHPTEGSRSLDYQYYFEKLQAKGIFSFDSENLIFDRQHEPIIEYLKPAHYYEPIVRAYQTYCRLYPLNAKDMTVEEKLFWEKHFRLRIDDFCRLSFKLSKSPTLDSFIKMEAVDYDNIAPLIESLLTNKLVGISVKGDISDLINYQLKLCAGIHETEKPVLIPNPTFNQFPCDSDSLDKRVNLLKNRYPYCESINVAIIGDDDLLGDKLKNELWINPFVIEKDQNIIQYYRKQDRINIFEFDLLELKNNNLDIVPKSHTFITDPPYTLHGALLFIYTGLSLIKLDEYEREFYVILNPMIMGNSFITLIQTLAEIGVILTEYIPAFNHYPFPSKYTEYIRADAFSSVNNIPIPSYSSTSNLYIFEVIQPDMYRLRNSIKLDFIYEHYNL